MSIVVRDLEDQAAHLNSDLGQPGCAKKVELRSIIDGIVYALRELEELTRKYSSLATAQKNNWDRLRLRTDKIHDIRSRLQAIFMARQIKASTTSNIWGPRTVRLLIALNKQSKTSSRISSRTIEAPLYHPTRAGTSGRNLNAGYA